uniref:NADH-ubiquinone oxidoreductase chain 2 n=1 Tax=Salmostoma bacalia TaxID=497986 RepID=F3Y687_9TELE|nr:NADH dehydrogenase subunit 2 [Salmostoma bacalia]BAK22888.1 NADH dehydrogenase subunit 2 [Salmostoma bacalia]
MSPYVLMVLLSSLGLGTAVTFASSHWLLAWMGLEISTLAIIPMMAQQHHPRAVEATTKYFLIQATAAAMVLFACTMNAWATGEWDVNNLPNPIASMIITVALALKIGMAPVHLWVPEVLQGLDLMTGMIMSTWQKLAPFALIVQTNQITNSTLLTALAVASTLVGGWGGLNQTHLRKIMGYSSIAHMGWLVIVSQYAPQLTMMALGLYVSMTSATFLTLKMLGVTKVNGLAMAWSKNPVLTAISALLLLSLGGLPPLTGFLSKWLILQELTKQGYPALATIMALAALISLYYYLRLCYTMVLTIYPSTINFTPAWRTDTTKSKMTVTTAATIATGLLPVTPAVLMSFM